MIEDPNDLRFGRRGRRQRSGSNAHSWPPIAGLHDVAVHVEDTERGAARLAIAKDVALAHHATLHGIGILEADARPMGPSAVAEAGSMLFPLNALVDCPAMLAPAAETEGWAEAWAARRAAMESWFKNHMQLTPNLTWDWRDFAHGSLEQMVGAAKASDLTIFGPHHPALSLEVSPGIAPEDIALQSGRPVLVVRSNVRVKAVGHVVLIAWDGSRETIRALYDVMPLCRDAGRIVVLHVKSASEVERSDYPGPETGVAILARHGFVAEMESEEGEHGSVVDSLFDKAALVNADLIAAGFPHHSRLRDTLFGSVCHDLIRQSPIPILLSH
jgi:nucleotide-binding universal stress UspA family protein